MLYTIILSILFAVTMKIADNLNEHGLKWFKGSNIIFGFLCGTFGALLILQNSLLVNLWIAVLIGWILRTKIDYLNHGIAACIILITFIFNLEKFQFNQTLFLTFFIGMVVSGLIHDYLSHNKRISKTFSEFFHTILYYTLLPLIYCIITKEWLIFASLFSWVAAYEIVRFYFNKKIKGVIW